MIGARIISLLLLCACIYAYNLDGFVLDAHGSSRSLYAGGSTEWTRQFVLPNVTLHLPIWWFGSTAAGGIAMRESDGHLFVPFVGDDELIGVNDKEGSAEKFWSPAYIWEVDVDTGKTVKVYDLSKVNGLVKIDCFESWLKFTPDGYPFFSGYRLDRNTNANVWAIVILDKEDPTKLVYTRDFTIPPEIPAASPKTNPQQLIWASDSSAEGVIDLINGHQVNRYFLTAIDNTALFNAYGNQTLNDHLSNNTYGLKGIHVIDLPITETSVHRLVVKECGTAPWVMLFDLRLNYYAICGVFDNVPNTLGAWDKDGNQLWVLTGRRDANWDILVMSDDETVIVGSKEFEWAGYDPLTGKRLWDLQIRHLAPGATSCVTIPQPFSPRVPMVLGQVLLLQCYVDNYNVVLSVDMKTGKPLQNKITFSGHPMQIMADGSGNVYGVYELNGAIVVERRNIGTF